MLMTDNALKKLEDEGAQMNYVYSYRFYNRHLSKSKQMDRLADISREITDKGFIFVDSSIKSTNSRISYVADDMGGDVPMMMSLFVIIMVIMAFVFAVIIKSTIEEEATVIGEPSERAVIRVRSLYRTI